VQYLINSSLKALRQTIFSTEVGEIARFTEGSLRKLPKPRQEYEEFNQSSVFGIGYKSLSPSRITGFIMGIRS